MARLIFRNGPYANKALTLPEGKTLTIGRNRDLELPLPDLRLSRRHCQIEPSTTGFVLRDLASTNGSFLNGKRVETEVQLSHLDVILIGDTEIEFQMPEAIDQGQTRIGPAATKARTPAIPVRVSPALEPATGPSTAAPVGAPDQLPAGFPQELGTGAVAPVAVPIDPASNGQLPGGMGEDSGSTGPVAPIGGPPATAAPAAPQAAAPVPAAAQQQDPLEVAIAELDMPLPPEPSIELPARPQVVFCDQCNGSIPIVHVDLCIAKEIDGKLFCRECMAKGVPGGKPGAWPPPEHWGKSASTEDIDDILKGLDQVEEIPQQQNAAPAAHPDVPVEGQMIPVAGPPKTQSAFERLLEEPEPEAPKKPKPKSAAPSPEKLFGDEFEEIG